MNIGAVVGVLISVALVIIGIWAVVDSRKSRRGEVADKVIDHRMVFTNVADIAKWAKVYYTAQLEELKKHASQEVYFAVESKKINFETWLEKYSGFIARGASMNQSMAELKGKAKYNFELSQKLACDFSSLLSDISSRLESVLRAEKNAVECRASFQSRLDGLLEESKGFGDAERGFIESQPKLLHIDIVRADDLISRREWDEALIVIGRLNSALVAVGSQLQILQHEGPVLV